MPAINGKLDLTGANLTEQRAEEISRNCNDKCFLCKEPAMFYASYSPVNVEDAAAMELLARPPPIGAKRQFFFMLCEEDLARVDIADAVEKKFYSRIAKN